MSEIRETLVKTINGVLEGKVPLDTAKEVHLTAHRHVMDRYADDKEARRIGDAEVLAKVLKAQSMIKGL